MRKSLMTTGLLITIILGCTSQQQPSGGDGGTPVGGDGGGVVVQPCTTDADCRGDGGDQRLVCNSCTGLCQVAEGQPCKQDVNCNLLSAWCDLCLGADPAWGRCRTLAGLCGNCTSDNECGSNTLMKNKCMTGTGGAKFCGRDCSRAGQHCPLGYFCSDEGSGIKQCRPCGGDGGVCNMPGSCTKDSDCSFRHFCAQGTDVCPVCTQGCIDDQSCGTGMICHDNGRCSTSCLQGYTCPEGFTCSNAGRCILPDACLTNADCRTLSNPPHYCNTEIQRCVVGCDEDLDCLDASKYCERATRECKQRPCIGTYQCAFGQFCNIDGGVCYEAEGPYCAECTDDNACRTGPGFEQNICVEFQDPDGGSYGKYCIVIPCTPQVAETGCPQGYQCVEIEMQSGTTAGCLRHCWVPARQ